jgi:Fic family protein
MMNRVIKLSKELPFLREIDILKKEVDKHKPLSKELNDKIFQKLRLDWNYNSNAIEGNSFTYGETIALLMEGITAKGKPLKDALDIKGHNDAIDFMMDMVKNERKMNETDIRNLHMLVLGKEYYNDAVTKEGLKTKKLIQSGKYKTSPNHVQTATGEIHYYATPEETPIKMKELVDWFNTGVDHENIHPLVLASVFHHRFVAIHPFDDGNGRMTRILTNFILLKFGYPVAVIRQETKKEYYACLSQADNGQIIPIIEYISNSVKDSLKIYSKGIAGEDISEPDDLDKEIALFRKEIGFKTEVRKFREFSSALNISFEVFSFLKEKLDKFSDLFFTKSEAITDSGSGKISINGDRYLKDKNLYKQLIKDRFRGVTSIIYEYDFNRNIDVNDKNISITLKIHFKKENYIIYFDKKKVVKYYDEKIIDDNYKDIVKYIIDQLMKEIKKIKDL